MILNFIIVSLCYCYVILYHLLTTQKTPSQLIHVFNIIKKQCLILQNYTGPMTYSPWMYTNVELIYLN